MLLARGWAWVRRLYSTDDAQVDSLSLRLPAPNIRAIHAAKSATLLLLIGMFSVIHWTLLASMDVPAGIRGIIPSLLASTAVALWPRPASQGVLLLVSFLDAVVITNCIHLGGGTQIVTGPMAYVVILGLAGILLSESATWATAAVVIVSYALTVWGEGMGWLHHYQPYMRPPVRQAVAVVMVSFGAVIATVMVIYVVGNLRSCFRQAEIQRRELVARLSRLLQHPLEQCLAGARRITADYGAQRLKAALQVQRHAADAIEVVQNVLETARLEGAAPGKRTTVIGRQSLQRIFLVHSAVIVFVLGALMLLKQLVVPGAYVPVGTAALFLALVPNVIGAFSTRGDLRRIAVCAMAADAVAVTYVIHLGGGIEAPAGPMYYVILVGVAGLIFAEGAAFITAAACALAYALLIWAEYTGVLDHYFPYLRPPESQLAGVLLVGGCLLLAAWLVSYAVRQLRSLHERAEDIRREAVSTLSHDLKNPLQVVYSYAGLIAEVDADEQTDMARRIQAATRRALELVDGIDSAAGEPRPVTPRFERLRSEELLCDVVEQFSLAALQKGIHLETIPGADLPEIEADPELLERAVGNLVSNAIKYTGAGGRVEIRTAAADHRLVISVRDTGMGISAEDQVRLFEKYARTPSARSVEGTGLGLHIARSIAEAHGGSVHLESEVGHGSTFTLSLPVAPNAKRSAAA